MHSRISINTLSLADAPFERHVADVVALEATAIGPGLEEIVAYGPRAARDLLRDAGLAVATLTHRSFGFATPEETRLGRERLDATLAIAEEIGAETVTFTTGSRGALAWGEAAERFAAAMTPCAAHAREAGVLLSLEPTSHLYADVSIAHRLADVVELARMVEIGVGIDLFACWSDSDIDTAIMSAGTSIALVQVSDQAAGDRALPCRAVPGDGMAPLDRLMPAILRTGFAGYFDLELIGPRIVAEGHDAALRRAGARLGALIDHG